VSSDANVSVCDIQSVDRALQNHPICDDGEKRKGKKKRKKRKELEEKNKVSFFEALQGLEAARKYIQQFDVEDDILGRAVGSETSSAY